MERLFCDRNFRDQQIAASLSIARRVRTQALFCLSRYQCSQRIGSAIFKRKQIFPAGTFGFIFMKYAGSLLIGFVHSKNRQLNLVRMGRLELPRPLQALEPKSSASANSATSAL